MSDPFIAQIMQVAFNFAPVNWATATGQLMGIQQNAALFSLIGTTFGGNGTSNFQLPNLQSRVIIGAGNGPGLSPYVWGQQGGLEQVSLVIGNLPQHTHPGTFTPTGTSAATNVQALTGVLPGSLSATPAAGSLLANTGPAGTSQPKIYAPAGSGTAVNLGGVTGSGITGGTVTVGPTGSNIPFPILPPYVALTTNICLFGIFPSRN
jgi:microcystin-dependent protein